MIKTANLKTHRVFPVFLSLFAAAVFTAGCAGRQAAEQAAEAQVSVSAEALEESPSAEKDTAEKPAGTTAETKTEMPSESETAAPGIEEAGKETAEDEKDPDIENNGGYFVRKGDYVYFRVYGQDALPETALWADFMQPVPGSTSSVWRLNLKTNQYEKLFDDGGYGGLWFFQDSLWLNRYTDFGNIVYCVDPDTFEMRDLAWGKISGISPDGSHLVYENYNDKGNQAFYVTGDEEMDQVVYATEGETLTFCGVVGRDLFFLSHNYGSEGGRDELWQMESGNAGEDGKLILLGVFPDDDPGSAQFVQFLPDKDKVYVSVEYREGTGHFYAGSHYASAIPGKENSLMLLDDDAAAAREKIFEKLEKAGDDNAYGYDEQTLKMYPGTSGKPAFAPHLAGETAVRYNDGAYDLVLYDSPDAVLPSDAVTIFENWLPEFEYTDESEISCNPQIMEYVGNKVFTFYTESVRAPEEDIGWRYAYRLIRTNYEYFDPADPSGTDTGPLRHIDTVEAARRLSSEAIAELDSQLDPNYYGFFLSTYHDPTEIRWSEVFYNGAGIDTSLSETQMSDYMEASGIEELYTDVTAIHEKDIRNFVRKTTGTSYDDAKHPLKGSWDPVPNSDLYAFMHGDTNYQSVSFEGGWDLGSDTYRLFYTVSSPDRDFESWPYKVTFRIENGEWIFVSNLPE